MRNLELFLLVLSIVVGFLLYREYMRKTSVKIEHLNASEAGIQMDSTGIIFTKPVRFDSQITANQAYINKLNTNEIAKITELKFGLLPKGTILAFNQTIAPDGWALCDGTQGTPDLRGRFILGANGTTPLTNRAIGTTGGLENVILTIEQMPKHSHDIGFQNDDYNGCCGGQDSLENDGGSWRARTTSETGGSQTHENMPPFYVLTYIMKL